MVVCRWNIVKANEIDVHSAPMFRNLEQVDNACETRRTCQCRRDIAKANLRDRIDFNLAFFHLIAPTGCDTRTLPYANAALDYPASHSIAKAFSKDHS